ncbi:glucose-1-phosphate cytidylyltransferase [Desulfatibacillum alkenivorans DSM 16219]|jgi:glucose-1-phosphate cytidylyltransferase|uniref:Glucose-1-phosphate cytidylyltransferase n=1 Tax=Desulfatibacillum alkenivorans DSM 16219 TaxID=1121393 RepID=A0A1M6RX00_9BACT|nr:glucose-1-phosphate cytidylyltransferase [Desulfatibacillum alkenivorans]SHK36829.1 glucose-1-phosphate cytidylyltransferase [Desulfatibacillum alkenivorans DSM 16219]
MQVVILCGGLGTRLREETEFRPKPMVNIGARPILWHIMKIYSHYGLNDFVLALGYKGEMIKEYFCHYEWVNNDVTLELGKPENMLIHDCHEEAGWRITLSNTGPKTLKGGRIKKIEKYIQGDTFMLTYGDGVSDVNIKGLLDFHKSHGKAVTLTGVSPAKRFGELKLDGNQVVSFQEKPDASEGLINGGFFVCNRKIFDYLTTEDDCDFEYGPLERLAEEGELMVYRHPGFWACMDTLRDMDYLNGLWDRNESPWKVWDCD